MNAHALRVLEFPEVLDLVGGRAMSELGRERILEMEPGTNRKTIQVELARVEEMASLLNRNRDWAVPYIPDARAGLDRLALDGNVLEAVELRDLGRLLTSGRELRKALSEERGELDALLFLLDLLHEDRGMEKRIRSIVDEDGTVLDSASKELARIRASLNRAHKGIVRALEKLLASLPDRILVPDASVTIREGRYVIPVRREGRGEVGGVVLDESATGATVFVEPPLALQLTAELRELERDETREIHAILREQTEALAPIRAGLQGSQEALVVFDTLHARAKTAMAWDGRAPALLPRGTRELAVVAGRHPLLLAREEGEVVPFHLSLDPGERALVVSGPNTGGKSVFLKALGLVATMAQAGIIPPVGKGTRLPVFADVFADIGDEQSIAENLSTFSAHLENLKEIVLEAGPDALVLIDEMGTGTDPGEGAALSRSILEELVDRGTLAVVTSHLGALKRLDTPGSGIVNASLQFDPDRIEPTYRLQKGRPGRSYGLAIARRLGFPDELLDRAEGHLPREEARMEELLATLERKEKEASELVASLEAERKTVTRLRRELKAREEELEEREVTAESRAREEARRLLLDARQEVEEAIRDVRSAAEEGLEEEDALDEVSRRARRKVEEAARRQREKKPSPRKPAPAPADLSPGDRVSLAETGARGRVVEIREGRAVVETGGLRMQVPLADLVFRSSHEERSGEARKSKKEEASTWQGPEAEADPEVDLRGYRVDEVGIEVDRALDRAVLGGLGQMRIIHGKGTGALRERVAEILTRDPRVEEYRLGLHGEGGAGVTIIRLKG